MLPLLSLLFSLLLLLYLVFGSLAFIIVGSAIVMAIAVVSIAHCNYDNYDKD